MKKKKVKKVLHEKKAKGFWYFVNMVIGYKDEEYPSDEMKERKIKGYFLIVVLFIATVFLLFIQEISKNL